MYLCHACQKELPLEDKPGRRDCCPYCEAELHCCLNCRFYNPTLSNQCQETVAEWVVDKQRANFCDYFVFKDMGLVEQQKQGKDKAQAELDALFGKSNKG